MVLIKEINGKFLNYFTSSIVIGIGGVILSFISNLITFVITILNIPLPFDYIIINLIILLFCQVIGSFVLSDVFAIFLQEPFNTLFSFGIISALITLIGTFSLIKFIKKYPISNKAVNL